MGERQMVYFGIVYWTVALTIIGVILGLTFTGCVTVDRTITGESPTGEKYKYKASVTAFGGGGIEKASNAMDGEMKVFHPDGTPKIEVSIDATQKGSGLSSDSDALLAGIELLGRLTLP